MIRPDIKTFHNDWREKWLNPDIRRRHFLGKGALDLYRNQKEDTATAVKKLYPKFELEIAMPGISKENVEVFLSGDILTIRGVKEEEVNPSPEYIVKGLDLDLIERKFKLVEGLGLNKMEANFTNEVLKIIFYTNTEKEEPHRVIEVD